MAIPAPRTRTWSPSGLPVDCCLWAWPRQSDSAPYYWWLAIRLLGTSRRRPTRLPGRKARWKLPSPPPARLPTRPACRSLSRIPGKLSEVDVTVGQKVKAGDVLARVDTTELQAAWLRPRRPSSSSRPRTTRRRGRDPGAGILRRPRSTPRRRPSTASQKNLQATQDNASTTLAAAQADVHRRGHPHADQKALQSAQDQLQAALQADQTSLANAQQAYRIS